MNPNSKLEKYKWHKYDNMPSAYQEFEKLLKGNTKRLSEDVKSKLKRFPYRYRLAKSFIGIDAKEVGRTLIGYEAGMKVFLAYTAYEEIIDPCVKLKLEEVKQKNFNEILNKELADAFIKNKDLINLIRDNFKSKDTRLLGQIEKFIRGETNDVLCIAFGIRNLYAHGVFTATAGGVKNQKDKKLYFKLADALLKYCDKRFTNCVKKIWG